MALDPKKLTNVKKRPDGSFTAACPACQGSGGDAAGEHLIVFSDGRFGCVALQGDKAHRSEIAKLAGGTRVKAPPKPFTVHRQIIEEPRVLMIIGHPGRHAGESLAKPNDLEKLSADP